MSKCSGSLFSLTHRPLIREQQSCQPGQWSGEINVISPKNITNPYLDKKAWNVISHHSLSEVCSCVAANTLTLTPSHSSHRRHNPHQNNAEKLYFTREKKVLTLRLVVIGISSPASAHWELFWGYPAYLCWVWLIFFLGLKCTCIHKYWWTKCFQVFSSLTGLKKGLKYSQNSVF